MRLHAAILTSLLLSVTVHAPVVAQSGPGLPKITFRANELFTSIATIRGPGSARNAEFGHSVMHDGYLATLHFRPGGFEFYDVSNPYSPQLVEAVGGAVADLAEPHTIAQTSAYGGQHVVLMHGPILAGSSIGSTGLGIWDWSDIQRVERIGRFDIPGVTGADYETMFWFAFQPPYIYAPVGSKGLFVIDASDPANMKVVNQIPVSQLGGFGVGTAFAIGNELIIARSDFPPGGGMAILDISEPQFPRLRSTNTSRTPYGGAVNRGRLYSPSNEGLLTVWNIARNGLTLEGEIRLDPGSTTNTNYVTVQDGFAHVGNTVSYVKVDTRTPGAYTEVGRFTTNNSGRDEDWPTPLGNLVSLGDDNGFGTFLIPHQQDPDLKGPDVTSVVPRDGAVECAPTSRVGITMSDMVEIQTIDSSSFIVRPVGGAALSGRYVHQLGIVNFTPDELLQQNTTYEVVIPAGGIADWSGNTVEETFVSRFTTGGASSPIIPTVRVNPPANPRHKVAFAVSTVSGQGPFQYSWDFGDNTPPTSFSSNAFAQHYYRAPGHYTVVVTVTNGVTEGTDTFIQTIHRPVLSRSPITSTTVMLDAPRNRLWCVNTDNDTVTAIDTVSRTKSFEMPVGKGPTALVKSVFGAIWVVCRDDATIHVLDPNSGANRYVVSLPRGSAPHGIIFDMDRRLAYVTLTATGQVARVSAQNGRPLEPIRVGPSPRGLAMIPGSDEIYVSRFRSDGSRLDQSTGEVYVASASRLAWTATIPLAFDPGPDTESTGLGLPNYLSSLAITPDGQELWVPSKKDNITRGMLRSGEPLTFQNTVRSIVSRVTLGGEVLADDLDKRFDMDNLSLPTAVAFTPLGDYAFVALQGSNLVEIRDAYSGARTAATDMLGRAPRGLVVTADGATMFVHGFTSRTIDVFDVSGVTAATTFAITPLTSISTVANEALEPDVLLGKQIFYNAADRRMSKDGYISCASCHLDGGDDGQTWDFTERGEGLRSTTSLLG